jgi:hypothetical protein
VCLYSTNREASVEIRLVAGVGRRAQLLNLRPELGVGVLEALEIRVGREIWMCHNQVPLIIIITTTIVDHCNKILEEQR